MAQITNDWPESVTNTEQPKNDQAAQQPAQETGGFKLGAALLGWLAAVGFITVMYWVLSVIAVTVFLSRLQTALQSVQNTLNVNLTGIGITAGALTVVVAALAYYLGGYVAGRLARFSGTRQGFGVWIVAVVMVLLAGLAVSLIGASFNIPNQVSLSNVTVNLNNLGDLTATGVITLIIMLAVTLGAAILGGRMGERYHRKVDQEGF